MRSLRRVAQFLAVVLALAACGDFGSEPSDQLLDQVSSAESRWRTHGTANYSYVLVRYCTCLNPPPEVRVHVANNVVVSATNLVTEEAVPASQLSQFRPLHAWFDIARDALRRRVPQFQATYDDERGYVKSLVINYDITTASDDVWFDVRSYTPAP